MSLVGRLCTSQCDVMPKVLSRFLFGVVPSKCQQCILKGKVTYVSVTLVSLPEDITIVRCQCDGLSYLTFSSCQVASQILVLFSCHVAWLSSKNLTVLQMLAVIKRFSLLLLSCVLHKMAFQIRVENFKERIALPAIGFRVSLKK